MVTSFRAARVAAAALALLAGLIASHAAAIAAPLPAANIVLKSALSVDPVANTVVLPVHKGTAAGKTVWYIVTDSSDKADAAARGVVYAPLLAGVRPTIANATQSAGVVRFAGAPDFRAARAFAPGPAGFPPANAVPGGTASAAYSPFVRIAGSPVVLNAPIVATGNAPFDVATHTNTADRVLSIDGKTVTLLLAHGFAAGHEVVYISTEASDAGAAAIERATYVPSLAKAEVKIPILVFANGQTGADNAQAQGLAHAALDTHLNEDATSANASALASPRNVLTSFPTGAGAAGYTPLWDASVGVWSPAAVAAKKNTAQTSAQAVYALAADKALTGPDGKPFGPVGFVVNCPVVAYIDAAP